MKQLVFAIVCGLVIGSVLFLMFGSIEPAVQRERIVLDTEQLLSDAQARASSQPEAAAETTAE